MQQRLIYLIIVLSILRSACGLYFFMDETQRRCFIQEMPDDTTVTVNYKAEVGNPQHSNEFIPSFTGMHWEVRDSDKKVVLSRTYHSEGHFSFTSHWPGAHSICLQSNSSASLYASQLRVHLDIRAGERTVDYDNVRQKEKLDYMQLKIRQLQNQADEISKEQSYQRFLGQQYRHASKCLYSKMVWWSVVQDIILVVIFAHMIHNLNKLSGSYEAFCKVLSEKQFARFRTVEAFNALMAIIGPEGQRVSSEAISQWITQIPTPSESADESEQMDITGTLLGKVEEFTKMFLSKQLPVTKEQYYAPNVNSMNLLAGTRKDRGVHLENNTFLLVCECDDCKPKDSKSTGESTKS